MPKRVLILCTGNSCRSQMAEVIWNTHAAGDWEAISAGSRPSGYVHPLAIQALQEIDLPISGLESKPSQPFEAQPFDLVVTVCGNAQADCPVWPGADEVLHWPFDDPADATGSDDEKMECFRAIRNQIQTRIVAYLQQTAD
jgi:arsenate reductase